MNLQVKAEDLAETELSRLVNWGPVPLVPTTTTTTTVLLVMHRARDADFQAFKGGACSKMFQDVPRCSKMFQDVPGPKAGHFLQRPKAGKHEPASPWLDPGSCSPDPPPCSPLHRLPETVVLAFSLACNLAPCECESSKSYAHPLGS